MVLAFYEAGYNRGYRERSNFFLMIRIQKNPYQKSMIRVAIYVTPRSAIIL